jgi:hypothetical protein
MTQGTFIVDVISINNVRCYELLHLKTPHHPICGRIPS